MCAHAGDVTEFGCARSAHTARSAVDQVFSPAKVMSESLESLARDYNWTMAQQSFLPSNVLHHSHGVAITQVVKMHQSFDVLSAGLIYVQDTSDIGHVLTRSPEEEASFLPQAQHWSLRLVSYQVAWSLLSFGALLADLISARNT